jgi:eukaryotic-like serine/threonine-protein kinase
MTPEEWQRLRPILESALELDSAHRTAYLDGACADGSLRREVESLIAVHEQAGTNVLEPGSAVKLKLDEEAQFRLLHGKRIGVYEIAEEIAVGGMGAVYRAIRADGQYKQQVALKIVRSELGAEFTAARFRNERQILATLDHPNIAKILDGGTTVDGLPYFVMEFIDGLPITEYCDQRKLPIDARLKIFRTVCSAVHYAHQHLVIHRDIKPGNILITSDGIPKLLDFGIAKILDPTLLGENAAVTLAGLWVMTPEYASPEQLRGEAITTATDVYSLGLVLYEMLAGHCTYHLANHPPHEIARAVLESDPEKPSTAIRRKDEIAEQGKEKAPATPELISRLRADSPENLHRRIAGDLDNIVLKAIRKDPRERYNSADQLSEDIRRHQEHLPVVARKSTVVYRCRQYVLRHKVGVTAAALVLLSLLTGLVLTLREARIARANELRAERRFNDVRTLANSLMFEVHDSIRDLPGATAARKLIIQRAQEYLDSLAQESKSDPKLLRELAAAYARLASVQGNGRDANVGDTPKAVQNYHKAAELLEADVLLEPANRDARLELAQTYMNLGMCLSRVGEKDGYRENTQRAIGILEPLAASMQDDQKTQALLGEAYAHAGFASRVDPSQALNYHAKALAVFQQLAKLDPKNELYQTQLSFSHKRVGAFLTEQNQLSAALEHERAALEIDEAQLALHPDSVKTRYNITFAYNDTGDILDLQGDFDGALRSYQKALEIRTALVQADPQDTKAKEGLARTHNYIGWNRRQKGDLAAALVSYRKGLALREMLSEKDPANEQLRFEVAQSESNIGDVYAAMALRPGVAAKDELTYCRESETWNRRALPMWLQMKAQGKLLPSDEERLTKINQNLEKCGRITAPVSQTKSPATPVRPN